MTRVLLSFVACLMAARAEDVAPAPRVIEGRGVTAPIATAGASAEQAELLAAFDVASGQSREFAWRMVETAPGSGRYAVTFPSPRPSGVAPNDTVWCRYYPAAGAAPESPRPAVLVLHHLGGDFGIEAALAAYLAAAGIHALEVEFPYYNERAPAGEDPRARMLREDVHGWVTPMQQVVADLRRATDWITARPDVDPARVGVTGISLGGIIGALTIGVEPRLVRNVLVIAGGDLPAIIMTPSRETEPMRQALAEKGTTLPEVAELLHPIEPLVFAARAVRGGTLMINAERDQVVPRASTDALYEALDHPEILWLASDHHGIALYLGTLLPRIRDHFLAPAAASPPAAPPPAADDEDEWF